jgi:hypothetical protein
MTCGPYDKNLGAYTYEKLKREGIFPPDRSDIRWWLTPPMSITPEMVFGKKNNNENDQTS